MESWCGIGDSANLPAPPTLPAAPPCNIPRPILSSNFDRNKFMDLASAFHPAYAVGSCKLSFPHTPCAGLAIYGKSINPQFLD